MRDAAVIKVGAATGSEMKEKKARVQDAMHATKVADLMKAGVIDPTKFVRAAPANGSSIA